MDGPIVVQTFSSVMDAQLAKALLESEGIKAFVLDANSPLIGQLFMGRVRLAVSGSDAERAKAVLAKASDTTE